MKCRKLTSRVMGRIERRVGGVRSIGTDLDD